MFSLETEISGKVQTFALLFPSSEIPESCISDGSFSVPMNERSFIFCRCSILALVLLATSISSLTLSVPVLPSYRNQAIDLHSIYNQLTDFYTIATLALTGLIYFNLL